MNRTIAMLVLIASVLLGLGWGVRQYGNTRAGAQELGSVKEAVQAALTKANRKSILAHILGSLGDRIISSVKPHEIVALIIETHSTHPQKSKRILFEIRDLFNEAMSYGWIDRNPL